MGSDQIDQSHIDEALSMMNDRMLELGSMPLVDVHALLNGARIKRKMSWGDVAQEANVRAIWFTFSIITDLHLADITNYIVWLAQNERGREG